MQETALFKHTPVKNKKHSRKRKTVQISGWGRPQLKEAMELIAKQEGISLSQIVVSFCEAGVAEKLHIQQEILAEPILRKLIREELRPLRNSLSEFHGRELFELGQVRWLFINKLYREVIHPEKKFTTEELYTLLDASR
jgi:hypothetical protein